MITSKLIQRSIHKKTLELEKNLADKLRGKDSVKRDVKAKRIG